MGRKIFLDLIYQSMQDPQPRDNLVKTGPFRIEDCREGQRIRI